jgi:transposase
MKHIAIDLGGMESQVCVRDPDGSLQLEGKRRTRDLDLFLKSHEKSRVIVETSAEAFKVADAALAAGHEVRVVPATLVKSLGVGSRRTKTDIRDAEILSEVSCRIDLPSVHIPSEVARHRRSLCALRETLVSARTQLINSVRGYLRTQLVRAPTGNTDTFPHRVRKVLERRPEGCPMMVERLLVSLDTLNDQIALADEELEQLAEADPICQQLMTTPGVGPVTAVRFVAALDRIDRFESAHKVEAYLGLTPGENSSSTRQRRTGITKAGPPQVRWTLTQAAWCLWRTRPQDRNVLWAQEIAKKKGRPIAIVALTRKLAGILFALWRDRSTYDPAHRAPSEEIVKA